MAVIRGLASVIVPCWSVRPVNRIFKDAIRCEMMCRGTVWFRGLGSKPAIGPCWPESMIIRA